MSASNDVGTLPMKRFKELEEEVKLGNAEDVEAEEEREGRGMMKGGCVSEEFMVERE